jgi:hypothetical protein
MPSALACGTALAIMALAAAPGRAASPPDFQVPLARDAHAEPTLNMDSGAGKSGEGKTFASGLPTKNRLLHLALPAGDHFFQPTVASSDVRARRGELRAQIETGSHPSRRIFKSTTRDLLSPGYPGPRFNLETLPVRVLGRRLVVSHFTVGRKGVRAMLSTRF